MSLLTIDKEKFRERMEDELNGVYDRLLRECGLPTGGARPVVLEYLDEAENNFFKATYEWMKGLVDEK